MKTNLMKSVAACVAETTLYVAAGAQAQTRYWTGATNNLWYAAGNWANGVPDTLGERAFSGIE